MKKSLLVLLSVIVLVIFFGPVKLKANDEVFEKVYCEATIEDKFIDNQILVVVGKEKSLNYYDFKNSDFIDIGCINIEDLTASRKEEVLARVSGEENNINLDKFRRILLLTLNKNDKQNVLDCIKKLEKRDDIKGAEPNYCDTIIDEENDSEKYSLLTRSVSTDDTDAYEVINNEIIQWATSKISLEQAWEVEDDIEGLSPVNVVIIDEGVQAMPNGCSNHTGHQELIGVVDTVNSIQIENYNELCYGCNPYISSLYDASGHGTFIAGIIGAKNDNYGIRGVSKTANIISYRFDLDANGSGEELGRTRGISAIIEASELSGNVVVNYSCVYDTQSLAECTAIDNFNGLLVCIAGNYGTDNDLIPYYPSSYTLDNIISVGASTINDTIWEKSNYCSTSVDLFAPGHDIVSAHSASHNGLYKEAKLAGYCIDSGTSFAAPYVAGVASMIWSRYPNLSALDVKDRILSNVDYSSEYDGKCVTGGRLNAYKAYIGEHNHSFVYQNYDAVYHTKECNSCYYYKKESHIWRSVSSGATPVLPGLKRCNLCGAEKFV